MMRTICTILLTVTASTTALGHFVFIVPDADGVRAALILSETLMVDAEVDAELVRPSRLFVRTGGKDMPLALQQTSDAYMVTVPGTGTRVIHGVTDLGVSTQGPDGKPHVLVYYPKAIIGDAFDVTTVVGTSAVIELVPVRSAGGVRLKLLARGQPRAGAEVAVILPGGGEKKLKTDDNGWTDVIESTGRFGAWARFWEDTPGRRGAEAYGQVRHYATLVFSVAR